ncbi:MAG: aldehyde dehydrogenase family protein, partial [Vicinamibacteria bacterium]
MNAPHPSQAVRTPPRHFIGGSVRAGATGAELPVSDPSDGKPFASIARGEGPDVDAAVRAARAAFDGAWGKLAPVEKGRRLMALSRAIADHADELAWLEARDCGKPMKQARADVVACARYFEYYAGAPDKLH